jgi:phosphoglycerate dehydrogenase-like enzyme
LSGAGLGTFDEEPPNAGKLRVASNLITTSHSAFYSMDANKESGRNAATQVGKLSKESRWTIRSTKERILLYGRPCFP